MKKKSFTFGVFLRIFTVLAICTALFMTTGRSHAVQNQQKAKKQASAADAHDWSITVGVAAEYLWWQPAFRDTITTNRFLDTVSPNLRSTNKSFDMDPGFAIGPVLTVGMPRGFGFTSIFLWSGWNNAKTKLEYPFVAEGVKSDNDITKWELDTALNYSVNAAVKVLVGVRWMGMTIHYDARMYMLPVWVQAGSGSREDEMFGAGPEVGLKGEVGLWGPLSLAGSFSLLYLYTTYDAGRLKMIDQGVTFIIDEYRVAYHTLGIDTSLALECAIPAANITLTLGFRYQYLHYIKWDEKSDSDVAASLNPPGSQSSIDVWDYLTEDDHIYGITLSATYEFDL